MSWAAHHWKYWFREQRSLVTFAYNCAHIVPRNLVNHVVGAHFSFIVLKPRNHEVKLPLARPHCPALAGRWRAAEPAGVVPNTYRSQMAGAEMVRPVPVRLDLIDIVVSLVRLYGDRWTLGPVSASDSTLHPSQSLPREFGSLCSSRSRRSAPLRPHHAGSSQAGQLAPEALDKASRRGLGV